MSTGCRTTDHTPGLLALTQASVGTAWRPGPAGLRAHGEGHRLIPHVHLVGGFPLSMWWVRVDTVGAFLGSPEESGTKGQDVGTGSVRRGHQCPPCAGDGGVATWEL